MSSNLTLVAVSNVVDMLPVAADKWDRLEADALTPAGATTSMDEDTIRYVYGDDYRIKVIRIGKVGPEWRLGIPNNRNLRFEKEPHLYLKVWFFARYDDVAAFEPVYVGKGGKYRRQTVDAAERHLKAAA